MQAEAQARPVRRMMVMIVMGHVTPSGLRLRTEFAPSRAKASAISLPMPLAAPVMTAAGEPPVERADPGVRAR